MMIATSAKLRELVEAASPGPWWNESGVIHAPLPNGGTHHPLTVYEGEYTIGDPNATGNLAALAPALARLVLSLAEALEHLYELSNLPADIPYYEMRDALFAASAALAAVKELEL